MDIFGQLGINTTAAFQFVLFIIALGFLSKFVFTPYAHALDERQKRTKGGEDLAIEFHNKSVELQATYETKIKDLNGEIKSIVDAAKSTASKDYETLVSKTRADAETLIHDNRSKIVASVQAASIELQSQTPVIAMAINNKLLK